MVAFGRKGYRAALLEVFEKSHAVFASRSSTPSPVALTQARRKLSETMLRGVFNRLSGAAHHVQSHAQMQYRDFQRPMAPWWRWSHHQN